MSSDDEVDIPLPAETDLYEVLAVSRDASADQIKSAYRKAALKHHPDKAPADAKDAANEKFQQIAFAYAILSDEKRRRQFDLTGSTADVIDDDDDFDWVDFYREQFSSAVDSGALEKLRQEYQGSEEERRDVLAAYEQHEGDLDKVYETIMLCNVLDDDERFRALIDAAIAEGRVSAHAKYTEEPARKRQTRWRRAEKEAAEAEEASKEMEADTNKKKKGGSKKKKKDSDLNDLAALIQQRQADRGAGFLDRLETKYGGGPTKRRAADDEEPPEEAFHATAARRGSQQQAAKKGRTKA